MSTSYYDRVGSRGSDGKVMFTADRDKVNEKEVQSIIEEKWLCELHDFGMLCPIDFYATRDGRMVGVVEVKSRTHSSYKYPTVFLNVRKWLSLCLAETGLGVPALFVAKFTDCVKYIRVPDIDASRVKIGGTTKLVKSSTDIEPLIEVLIEDMQMLEERV